MKGRRLLNDQVIACCIYSFTCNSKPGGMDAPGVSIRQSKYSVNKTIDLIESFLLRHDATIYARINQEAEVRNSGKFLSPPELLLFGIPGVGGKLMAQNPLIALDLPLKVMAWQDGPGRVWLGFNDGVYLEKRYSIPRALGSALHLDRLIDLALV